MLNATKKKRVSKKNKESWRKHIDISDVNAFLDDQRLEERIGKVSDKTNDELFTVDVKPAPKPRLTAREQRRAAGLRAPRSLAGLINTSKVQDPIVKRNHVRTQEERPHFIAKKLAAENGKVSKRVLQSTEDKLKAYKKFDEKKTSKKQSFDKDVWLVGDLQEQRTEFKSQWIEKYVFEHNISNTGTPVASVPKSAFHKRSQLNAITIPHPGTSYNPTLKDHTDLLNLVTSHESKIIRNEDHLNRVTTAMFDKMTAKQRDANLAKELNSGMDDENDEELAADDSLDENENGIKSINPPIVVKKKDQKARRKQREQKEIKQRLLNAKLEKKKVTDIHRLRHLKEDIVQLESKLKLMRSKKVLRREEKKVAPRRIGKNTFQEEEIDINLPGDIAGNLRNVKLEGSVLKDRFRSMQRRNILAPTVDIGLRKRKEVKRFTRKSHQEVQEPLNLKQQKKPKLVLTN